MPTIRDVARRASVSQATASRALSGRGPVSSQAAERVRAAAQDLGYEVNKSARALRTQRTDTIGLLIPDVRNPFFTELAYIVEQEAAHQGLAVITMSVDEDPELESRSLKVLLRQQVDGIIVAPRDDTACATVDQVPVVFVDRGTAGGGVPLVRSDNEAGAALMIDHLVSMGHRDIAMITGPREISTGRVRHDAAMRRLAHHGLTPPPAWVLEGDFQLESGRRAAAALIDGSNVPSAVFAGDNLMAIGALQEIHARGLHVGTDIALTGFDDAPWFPLLDPPLTVVAQDVAELGRAALQSLAGRLFDQEVDDVVIPVQLRVRASCAMPTSYRPPPTTTSTGRHS